MATQLLTNEEIFKLLSQPFIKQKDLVRVLNSSQSKISKLLKKFKILDKFGLGYSTNEVMQFLQIDLSKYAERTAIELKANII